MDLIAGPGLPIQISLPSTEFYIYLTKDPFGGSSHLKMRMGENLGKTVDIASLSQHQIGQGGRYSRERAKWKRKRVHLSGQRRRGRIRAAGCRRLGADGNENRTDGRTNGRTDERTDGRMDERTGGRTKRRDDLPLRFSSARLDKNFRFVVSAFTRKDYVSRKVEHSNINIIIS